MGVIRAVLDSRWLWILLGCGLAWTGGRWTVRNLARDPRFLARPDEMAAGGPAWGGEAVVQPVLDRLRVLGPLNLFDPQFEPRIRSALAEVPGVATVGRVRRAWPRRYTVDVRFHRPVAVVSGGSWRVKRRRYGLPVTAEGRALPAEPYVHAIAGVLAIDGVDESPPALGRAWQSEALADGLATVAQLTPHLERLAPLGIAAVDVTDACDARRGVVLRGADGTTVRWGRPRARVGENSVAKKIGYLVTAARHLERVRGFEIDVRFGTLYLRASRGADEPAVE
ncbi:MAG: cell division protein FtsQ/DivIB [Planctomycetota bacterium]